MLSITAVVIDSIGTGRQLIYEFNLYCALHRYRLEILETLTWDSSFSLLTCSYTRVRLPLPARTFPTPPFMAKKVHSDKDYKGITSIATGQYENCQFTNCQLTKAKLNGAQFIDCTFVDCTLINAKMKDTGLQSVTFKGCNLLGVQFDDCKEFGFSVKFRDCSLELSSFCERKLKGISFKRCKLIETDFRGANLQEASFADCDLDRAVFERTDLRKADLRTAVNFQISPEENRLRGTKFSQEGLIGLLKEYGIVVEN